MKLQKNNKPIKLKNPKEFDIKFNNFLKAAAIATTTLVIATGVVASIISKELIPTDKKTTISEKYNSFEDFIKIEDNKTYYKAENIKIAVNKDTLEFEEYIEELNSTKTDEIKSYKLYEISTGDLVNYYKHGIIYNFKGTGYLVYLKNNFDFYSIESIKEIIEIDESKKWYTLEEIKELEERMLQVIKEGNQYKKIK